ncbi:MAG: phosphatidate cytidylyltransferase [Alphaproteobacteria bacterium]|nr:phosphatidate cytidylyltransferase [Alphaproteobacteria bacterium]
MNFSTLQTRAISAVALAPAVVFIIFFGSWVYSTFVLICFLISLYEWLKLARGCSAKGGVVFFLSVAGLGYLLLSAFSFLLIRSEGGAWMTLFFFLLVWASDIGAYFSGKLIGGKKMAPTISPNKTWAGFGGALLFPAFLALGWVYVFDYHGFSGHIVSFLLGIAIGTVGQSGDLLISAMKRKAGVKDTGTLIPGHGGLLDRIDSMLLGAPLFLWFLLYIFAHVSS